MTSLKVTLKLSVYLILWLLVSPRSPESWYL